MARQGGGPIALRLALTFVSVALTAVALLAGLAAVFVAADVSHLVSRQQSGLTRAVAVAAGAAWDRSDSWASADLSPVLDLAGQVGADVQVRDRTGVLVSASPRFSGLSSSPQQQAPVVVRQHRVGRIIVRFGRSGLAEDDAALRADLWRAIAGAAGLAALRAMGRGDRSARVGDIRGPGELRDLSEAFDQMADSLARQEKLRRKLVADVAHELRTPVAVLQVGHEALLDGVVQPTPGQLGSLRDEVLRLARIVDDLRVLSSAEAAALQLTRRRCDL